MSAGRELRIQQFLAQCGICSRRKAEVLLRNGHVSINGRVITEPGTKIVPGVDRVCVCGKPVARETAKLYAFHKPRGVVSTLNDPQGRPCVGEYVRSFPLRLFLVGRLDFDVCGLLLLTNDGKLADELLHPRHEVERVYWARVSGRPGADTLKRICRGVALKDGSAKARSARTLRESARILRLLGGLRAGESYLELIAGEGRKHFVKRILSAVGHPVVKLCRVRFGPYLLGELAPGEIREVRNYRK